MLLKLLQHNRLHKFSANFGMYSPKCCKQEICSTFNVFSGKKPVILLKLLQHNALNNLALTSACILPNVVKHAICSNFNVFSGIYRIKTRYAAKISATQWFTQYCANFGMYSQKCCITCNIFNFQWF